MAKRLTVPTDKLLGFLNDLIITADVKGDEPALSGVYLKSGRGPWGEEPGDVDLLIGASGNGDVNATTWIPAVGEIDESFWSIINIKNVKFVFAPLAKKHKANKDNEEAHVLEIVTDGSTVTIREYDVDEPTELQFPIDSNSDFPISAVSKLIANGSVTVPKGADGNEVEDGALTVWTPALSLVFQVAKRRKEYVRLYRVGHAAATHLVQIGDSWRGTVKPYIPSEEEADVHRPDSDLHI